jgi:hypothetical protein
MKIAVLDQNNSNLEWSRGGEEYNYVRGDIAMGNGGGGNGKLSDN